MSYKAEHLKQPRLRRMTTRAVAVLGAIVALLAFGGVATPTALADDVVDAYCPADGQQYCNTSSYWAFHQAPGQRCDLTAKFIGGTTTSVQFGFAYLATGWSGWLPLNGTFSRAWWGGGSEGGTYVDTLKAQANRSAWIRFRVTGPCEIVNN